MRPILLLVFSFLCSFLSAQKITYIHQNKSLQEIQQSNIKWENYEKPIYEGMDNGIYWFKIGNVYL